jgi:predicted MFS family arabinose efflux permease
MARIGAVLVAVGLGIVAAVLTTGIPVLLADIGWIVAGFGSGLGFTTNSIAVLQSADHEAGNASSQMELGNTVGIALGTGLGGLLIGSSADDATSTGIVSALALAALAAIGALVIAGRLGRSGSWI